MNTIQLGQKWVDTDLRNADTGKSGRAKPKYREVEIVALPTLSSPGVMRVTKAPRAKHTVGALRRFTRAKLIAHYARVSA